MNSIERFNNRVNYYLKYRPSYPAKIIDILKEEIGFNETFDIADIGSGTGLLSKLFVNLGNIVYGVEPNDEMREAAEKIFSENYNFISIKGTAENTTLANECVDLITAAQSFHWFNTEQAKNEFKRILRKNGYVVIIFNVRKNNTPFMKAYNNLQENMNSDYKQVRLENVKRKHISEFFNGKKFIERHLENSQELDFPSLKGRLLSCSYVPLTGQENKRVIKELKSIFDKYNKKNKVTIEYQTKIYIGKLH
ncbi:MAG: class I SAM-dependent methyltransferase [Ignavibacteria bacterium]|nr:class I SAM-dependent methyltransferase [Ignavibacteria bacterium]